MARVWVGGAGAALMAALAGCSDGGSGDDPVTADGYDQAFDSAVDLYDEATAVGYTPSANLPTSGGATYDGVMYLDTGIAEPGPDGITDLLGDLRLGVDFGDPRDAVTGEATDFVDFDDRRYDGTLALSNGDLITTLDPEEYDALIADLDGTLVAPDGTAYAIEAGLGADFRGEDHDYLVGGVLGEACGGGNCTGIEGGFVAER